VPDNEKEETLNAETAESPVSEQKPKPKHPGGRPPKAYFAVPVQEVLNLTAPVAARILQAHIERKRGYKTLSAGLQRACEYVIDHAIGKARQKIEHSGGVLTYSDLAKSAETLEKKPREVLADAEEIAHKYQQETAVKTEETPESL